jgi:hypothetical protein
VEDLVKQGVLTALMEGRPVPPNNKSTPDCRYAMLLNHHRVSTIPSKGLPMHRRCQSPHKDIEEWLPDFIACCEHVPMHVVQSLVYYAAGSGP